ncbi:MAG: hypothetical protein KC422_23080 [Trueperaceae bacterium]|nr:hypothetical protein [Trueperaceae bacterium]
MPVGYNPDLGQLPSPYLPGSTEPVSPYQKSTPYDPRAPQYAGGNSDWTDFVNSVPVLTEGFATVWQTIYGGQTGSAVVVDPYQPRPLEPVGGPNYLGWAAVGVGALIGTLLVVKVLK